jgi:hypothetical protein
VRKSDLKLKEPRRRMKVFEPHKKKGQVMQKEEKENFDMSMAYEKRETIYKRHDEEKVGKIEKRLVTNS